MTKMAHSFQVICWFLSWPFSLHPRTCSFTMTRSGSGLLALYCQLDVPPEAGKRAPVWDGGGLVSCLLRIHVYMYMQRGQGPAIQRSKVLVPAVQPAIYRAESDVHFELRMR